MAHSEHGPRPSHYYVPHGSHWPIFGSVGAVRAMVGGAACWLNEASRSASRSWRSASRCCCS